MTSEAPPALLEGIKKVLESPEAGLMPIGDGEKQDEAESGLEQIRSVNYSLGIIRGMESMWKFGLLKNELLQQWKSQVEKYLDWTGLDWTAFVFRVYLMFLLSLGYNVMFK